MFFHHIDALPEQIAHHKMANGHHAALLAEPVAETDQVEGIDGIGYKDQDMGPPVAGAHGTAGKAKKRPSYQRFVYPPPGIPPPGRAVPLRKKKPDRDFKGDGNGTGQGIDQKNHGQTGETPCKIDCPGNLQLRSPGGVATQSLQGCHNIDHSVGGKKKDRHHRRHGVQIPQKDRSQGDGQR